MEDWLGEDFLLGCGRMPLPNSLVALGNQMPRNNLLKSPRRALVFLPVASRFAENELQGCRLYAVYLNHISIYILDFLQSLGFILNVKTQDILSWKYKSVHIRIKKCLQGHCSLKVLRSFQNRAIAISASYLLKNNPHSHKSWSLKCCNFLVGSKTLMGTFISSCSSFKTDEAFTTRIL